MKPTPPGWPRLSSCVVYREAAAMIDWLCEAFAFELRLKVEGEGGRIEHSELCYGDAVVMVSAPRTGADASRFATELRSPLDAGCNTQTLMLYVDDADAHCERARARGARIVQEPALHDYGDDYWADRGYGCVDPEGHLWWFSQRVRG